MHLKTDIKIIKISELLAKVQYVKIDYRSIQFCEIRTVGYDMHLDSIKIIKIDSRVVR